MMILGEFAKSPDGIARIDMINGEYFKYKGDYIFRFESEVPREKASTLTIYGEEIWQYVGKFDQDGIFYNHRRIV